MGFLFSIFTWYKYKNFDPVVKFVSVSFTEKLTNNNPTELNDLLKEGYVVNHVHERESGLVFEVFKWERKKKDG